MTRSTGTTAAAAVILALALALTACTSPPKPEPTPEPAFTSEPMVLSGVGPMTVPLTIPAGAQSLMVQLACTGMFVDVSIGKSMEEQRGAQCGGTHTFVVPITGASRDLQINVADDSTLTVQLQFSDELVAPDPVMVKQCATVGEVLSTAANAAAAVQHGDMDAAEWRTSLDGAIAELDTIDPDTMIGHLAPPLTAWLEALTIPPQEFWSEAPSDFDDARILISSLCSDNGSALIIMGQYGG